MEMVSENSSADQVLKKIARQKPTLILSALFLAERNESDKSQINLNLNLNLNPDLVKLEAVVMLSEGNATEGHMKSHEGIVLPCKLYQ